jgi:hypothetical protein
MKKLKYMISKPINLKNGLKHQAPLNLSNVLTAPGYSSEVDGKASEPVLIAHLCGGTAIALRGTANGKPFTGTDMASLFAITPYIYRGLTSGTLDLDDCSIKSSSGSC